MISYKERARGVVDFLLRTHSAPTFLASTNVQQGTAHGSVMIKDLGDSMPFLYWAGQHLNDSYMQTADTTSKHLLTTYQRPSGFFKTASSFPFSTLNNFDAMTDLSLGINLMYTLTHDPFYLASSRKFFDAFSSFMQRTNYFMPTHSLGNHRLPLSFSTGKLGLYIEELNNLYSWTHEERYLRTAQRLSTFWIEQPFFKKHGLFPFLFQPTSLKPVGNFILRNKIGFSVDSAMSSKANSNLVFGLTALYRQTKDTTLLQALEHWHTGVRDHLLHKDGSLFSIWEQQGSAKFLGCDHAVIDCFLELYRSTKKKDYLQDALLAANFWLQRQDASGLIPQGVPGNQVCVDRAMPQGDKPNYYRLDPQTDFFVVLLKLYQITENKLYLDRALKLLSALTTHHFSGKSFVNVLDDHKRPQSPLIETKFLFLILKALLVDVYKKKNIYKDPALWLLLRDR
ncbi:hypothetical protein J4208_01395 [Candidatus Woesearchaeota archaeon]|nr:hypothetical protein [Candidatus Woesearchaeota archaeon]